MTRWLQRWTLYSILAFFSLCLLSELLDYTAPWRPPPDPVWQITRPGLFKPKFRWKDVKIHHPVQNITPLPSGQPIAIPRIQHDFASETPQEKAVRKQRLAAVKEAFKHSWHGYKRNAWLQDEVAPLSGRAKNPFGGWGATLVDSLDTLWIMGMEQEFIAAMKSLKKIDFATTPTDTLNVFETTIRYLGGLLSAYDVSGHQYPILLEKAVELGEMIYFAFDTPNHMPVTRWQWKERLMGERQLALSSSFVAEVGSFTLELTRLSQLTGDPKWYDAAARVMDVFATQQNKTKVPGLWPIQVNTMKQEFTKNTDFTFGALADSLYEYLPKTYLILGGHKDQYRTMFTTAIEAAKTHIFFHPLNQENKQLLIPGGLKRYSTINLKRSYQGQHLSCYAGGMVGIGAKIFNRPADLEIARQLTDGCIWTYESMPTGVGPEVFTALPCNDSSISELPDCNWLDEEWYHAIVSQGQFQYLAQENPGLSPREQTRQAIEDSKIVPGFMEINDARYILRPEAIESVFVMYRITGDKVLQEKAWQMFESIRNISRTKLAFASVTDVTQIDSDLFDSMESFWTAETLKYFYLIFSEPDVISLDEYVLNTEAHPFLRPK
ncbi:glycoside hydrolase family 47 protein [Polychaeton citri CBS 116435]|uniref:alpha-1,2-Mannosidase n=1 Tax=Polychaeton citri CBS 116435 TaxID=1314669 RepID=A0A9P4QAQ4_9PEZI|nr:glycoside hydrolase family 47 protein [Polychaeton citri CBS 116435]